MTPHLPLRESRFTSRSCENLDQAMICLNFSLTEQDCEEFESPANRRSYAIDCRRQESCPRRQPRFIYAFAGRNTKKRTWSDQIFVEKSEFLNHCGCYQSARVGGKSESTAQAGLPGCSWLDLTSENKPKSGHVVAPNNRSRV